MSRPPLSLVRLTEDPYSAREKVVTLTPKAERFLTTMVEQARSYLRPLLAKLSPEEIHNGLVFFRNGLLIVNDAAVGSLGTDTTLQEAGRQKAQRCRQIQKFKTDRSSLRPFHVDSHRAGPRNPPAPTPEEILLQPEDNVIRPQVIHRNFVICSR